MVSNVTELLNSARADDSEWIGIFEKATKMAEQANVAPILAPRVCSRQAHRSNTPAASPEEYFKRNIYRPFLDSLIQQFSMRFDDLEKQAIRGLQLIPSNISNVECVRGRPGG